jgi:hypothetical protein
VRGRAGERQMPRVDAFRGGAGVGCCLLDTAADHHTPRASPNPCRRRAVVRTRRAPPTVRRAPLARSDQRCRTHGGSGLSASGAPARADFTRSDPRRPSAAWSRSVQDLADDRLGQSTRVQPVIPLGVRRELVRDESAEWSGIEVLRMPGRQPQAGQVIAPCPPRSTSPPVSFVDHRVPPVAFPIRTARAGRSLSERRHEPGPGYIRFVVGRDQGPGHAGAFGG